MRKTLRRGKSSISKASSYTEIGEFWDEHDLSYWSKTRRVKLNFPTFFVDTKNISLRVFDLILGKSDSRGRLLDFDVRFDLFKPVLGFLDAVYLETKMMKPLKSRIALMRAIGVLLPLTLYLTSSCSVGLLLIVSRPHKYSTIH